MRERPILFSSSMVRAILAGRKSQTRRAIKFGEHRPFRESPYFDDDECPGWCDGWGNFARCPYGQPGDRLWVKETWRPRGALGPWDLNIDYAADGAIRTIRDGEFGDSDWTMPKAAERGNVSPLFMPRWASRILLEVTGMRVERLQDISEADAIAEGLDHVCDGAAAFGVHGLARSWSNDPRVAYRALWESINDPGSWEANPWVWVVEFKRIDQEPPR